MLSPEDSGNDALAEAIVRLTGRIEQIERRLARVEQPEQRAEVPETEPEAVPPFVLRDEEPPRRPADLRQLEARVGLTWINRIGVVTLVIGVGFFFKYAVDNQWIGETGRVVLGVLAGLASLAAGDRLWRHGKRIFAQGIFGLGIGVLYLSFYTSFGLYQLLPQPAAFVLMTLVTATAGALAVRRDAIAIAGLSMLGGYLTPPLLSTGHDAPWTLFSYIFLIDMGAVLIARRRRWLPLDALAFVATVVLYISWSGRWFTHEKQVVATAAALAFYALFAFVEWAWILYGSEVLAGAALVAVWPETVPYLVLSLALAAAGLIIADRTRRLPAAALSFATFWGGYALWRSAHGRAEEYGAIFLLLTLAFAMYLVWTPLQILMRQVEVRARHLEVIALNGAIYFGCSYLLLAPHHRAWMGLFVAGLAGAHLLLGMVFRKGHARAGRDTRPVLLALGVALAFLTLAVPIQFTGFRITLSWALEGAALTWISSRVNERRLFFGALAVYVFLLFRLYFFDAKLPEADSALVVNTRFATFAASAASLWVGAWWMKPMRRPAAAVYVAGHVVMLSACLFELNEWATRTASRENQGSLMAISVSILMALYAVLLIGIGVSRRSALDRILGVGLMGMVVLKLYVYDVWEASRLFRMAAFVALGVLLLLASYLYSRLMPAVQNWWKDEEGRGGESVR